MSRVKLPALKARGFPERNKAQFMALLDLSPQGGACGALPVKSLGESALLDRAGTAKHGVGCSLIRPHGPVFPGTHNNKNDGKEKQQAAPYDVDPFHLSPPDAIQLWSRPSIIGSSAY